MAENSAPNAANTPNQDTGVAKTETAANVFPATPAQYDAVTGQEAKAAEIVAKSQVAATQAEGYHGGMNGAETVAKEIVDSTRDANAKIAEYKGAGTSTTDDLNAVAPAAGQPMGKSGAPTVDLNGTTSNAAIGNLASHTLVKPAAGQTEVIHVSANEMLATQFDPNSADLSLKGHDLVMSFNDGGQIVLQGFADDAQNMPTIALPNGALVAGGIIVAQLQGTNEELFNLETAAGGAGGAGGNFIYSDDLGSVIGLLDKLPPILFTALTFGQPDPRIVFTDTINDPADGTFIPTFTTVEGGITIIGAGYEDWQPNQNVGDYSVNPIALNITFTPNDNEVVDQVTISNIPAGVQFFYDSGNGFVPMTIINGSLTFSGAALAAGHIYMLPPANSDGDYQLTISMLIRDPDSGQTAVISQTGTILVDAVADLPTIASVATFNGGPGMPDTIVSQDGQPINLNVKVTFPDNDGSETHTITIAGVPGQWTMEPVPGVTFMLVTNLDGTNTYIATVTGNFNHVITFNPNGWTSAGGDAHITLTAHTHENPLDGEIRLDNNDAEVSIQFGVHTTDDVPTIVSVSTPAIIPEHDLLIPGVDQVFGNIKVDFHNDGPGNIQLSLDGLAGMNLTSHGLPLTYSISADGTLIKAVDSNGNLVFTVGLGAPSQNGGEQTVQYVFTLHQPLDHLPGGGMNPLNIPIHFTATDNDGDHVSGTVQVAVIDDVPTAENTEQTADETQIDIIYFGQLPITSFGADGAGSVTENNQFSSSGSQPNGVLSWHGIPINVTLINGQYVGKAGGLVIFTLDIREDGTYEFRQFHSLDHADGSNPNDVINLNFGYQVTDFDGDVTNATVTIHVRDDAPEAHADVNTMIETVVATGNVITGLNGGIGAFDQLSVDDTNHLSTISVNGTTMSFSTPTGSDANGNYIIIAGLYGTLKIYENGNYTYTYDAPNHSGNHSEVFNYTLIDGDGDTSSTTLTFNIVDNGPGAPPAVFHVTDETFDIGIPFSDTIVIPGATQFVLGAPNGTAPFTADGAIAGGTLTSNNVTVTVAFVNGQYVGTANGVTIFTMSINSNGTYTFTQFGPLDHGVNTDPNEIINLHFTYTASDANGNTVSNTITINVKDDAPVAIADINSIPDGGVTATGNVITNDTLSKDVNNLLKDASFGGVTKSFAVPDGQDAGGKFVLLQGTYGVLKIYENGNYTYTYDTMHNTGNHTEQFLYTLMDHDGDTSGTTLTINITDNGPGQPPLVTHLLDETFDIGTPWSDTIVVPGATQYALGTPTGTGQFSAGGSMTGGALTSDGFPVVVNLVNGQYVGTANGVTIFTLSINANGTYTFTLLGTLDHADVNNPNDIINLHFTYTATDNDGDSVPGVIDINIRDDAPVAIADVNAVASGTFSTNGNVVTNDTLSQDTVNVLKDATFGGVTKSFSAPDGVDAGGKFVLLQGTYGLLKIYENGNYTYTYNNVQPGAHVEQFQYTLVDFDGDTSHTTLTINIANNGPGTAPTFEHTTDETTDINVAISDNVIVPGATQFALGDASNAGTFNASGSLSGGTLKSDGIPVIVSLVNGQYVGTANGVTIFTLTINANGTYTFTQLGTLDHADGNNPNDIINLDFMYHAIGSNGIPVQGHIVIHVRDDAPVAVADIGNIPDNTTVATGNVITNDTLSQDTVNVLKDASFGGVTKSFATPDGIDGGGKFVLLTGAYGVLKIYENGNYTYTYDTANHTGNHTEQFQYTLIDFDGDTSHTTLTFNITDSGPGQPPIVEHAVDETTDINVPFSDTIVIAGATQFDMGTVNGAPAFNATGSILGGALTSNGVPVVVTLVGGQYVGMAGALLVFTLSINNNGTYTFTLKGPLDHLDGNNANDIINLNFTYTARDQDGDAVESSITIHVLDDAPIAHADVNVLVDTDVATGNVITGLNGGVGAADTLSQDVGNVLKSVVSSDGTVKTFAIDGQIDAGGKYVMINGHDGVLKIYDNGNYTYTLNGGTPQPGNGGSHSDVFQYTIQDHDGDVSTTTLTLNTTLPTLIVGENVSDVPGSTTPYEVGPGSGTINGSGASDILIGDVGGYTSQSQPKDYNIALILDVSSSMEGDKIAMLRQAVDNLVADFHGYTGGAVKVCIVPFATVAFPAGIFDVSTAAGYAAAINFINGLSTQLGDNQYTNYEAPMQAVLNWFNGSMSNDPIPGGTNYTYFVSDGEPNRYMNGNTVTPGSAQTVMNEITGSDGTNEVGMLQGYGEVIGVGIGVSSITLGRLDIIDSDHHALDVQNPSDLNAALQGTNPVTQLAGVGGDVINGGDGNDMIFGDSLNTDHLAQVWGLGGAPGKGWSVFVDLETNHGWTRADTISYIRSHMEELAHETHGAAGQVRTGGNDTLNGGNGNDFIFGQEGNDVLNGGAGNDILAGGSGINTLTGGAGSDTFLFLKDATHSHDTITDYSNAQSDRLDISDLLTGGTYMPGVSDVEDYVRIDHLTGNIYVDASGQGHFDAAHMIGTMNNITTFDMINVILNDNEGIKIVHTS